jgi:hypothetical protein
MVTYPHVSFLNPIVRVRVASTWWLLVVEMDFHVTYYVPFDVIVAEDGILLIY